MTLIRQIFTDLNYICGHPLKSVSSVCNDDEHLFIEL